MIPDYEYPRQNGPTLSLEAFLSSPLLSSPFLNQDHIVFWNKCMLIPVKKTHFFVNLNFWYNKPFFNIQKVLYIQVSPDSLGSPWFPPGFE